MHLRRRQMDADYHFAAQFTADLIAMNHTDFIITSTFQEIAGTEVKFLGVPHIALVAYQHCAVPALHALRCRKMEHCHRLPQACSSRHPKPTPQEASNQHVSLGRKRVKATAVAVQESMGQYEDHSHFTLPGLYRVISVRPTPAGMSMFPQRTVVSRLRSCMLNLP